MGTAFTLPIRESSSHGRFDWPRLSGEFGIEMAAAVLDPAAEPLERVIDRRGWPFSLATKSMDSGPTGSTSAGEN